MARLLQQERRPAVRKAGVAIGVGLSLGLLALFKYLGFASVGLVNLLEPLGLSTHFQLPELAIPLGLSFLVFHSISLMVDVYRDQVPGRLEVLDALLYLAFFPKLIAGPILRAKAFLPQLAKAPDPAAIDASRAIELIAVGLVKKVLLANFLASHLVDPAFEAPGLHGGFEALLVLYGYAAQIYCDFSGYTDIASGSALLLGYRFPENFDAPYLARNPQDFWRRWHITLSSWLRDYLFIPLGGSRRGRVRTLANLAITLILGGLWHGAAWTFVAWGALHGAGLGVHRLWADAKGSWIVRLRQHPAWKPVAVVLTFHFVCVGWVYFRAPSIEVAGAMLRAVFSPWSVGPWLSVALGGAVAVGLAQHGVSDGLRLKLRMQFARLPPVVQGVTLAGTVLLIEALSPHGILPFIYFQF